jgi:GMP synthase-like glutamine amidotransferase
MQKPNICILQHVDFEKPAFIEEWAIENEFNCSIIHIYAGQMLPTLGSFDILVIMGGPMGVYESNLYPWLTSELEFIKESIDKNKVVLGICLGAQIIAAALGAKVYKGPYKEIGWFPVIFEKNKYFDFPEKLTVFHWHGDTFDLPVNAQRIASSDAIINQAFIYNNKVLALQFHIEVMQESVNTMIQNCASDLSPGIYVQSAEELLNGAGQIPFNKKILYEILIKLSGRID